MAGINDTIVVSFPPNLTVVWIRNVVAEYDDLVRNSRLEQKEDAAEMTLSLDRPDSDDPDEIWEYIYRSYGLGERLEKIEGCISAKVNIASFQIA